MLNNFQLSASLVILQNNFQTAFTAHKVYPGERRVRRAARGHGVGVARTLTAEQGLLNTNCARVQIKFVLFVLKNKRKRKNAKMRTH